MENNNFLCTIFPLDIIVLRSKIETFLIYYETFFFTLYFSDMKVMNYSTLIFFILIIQGTSGIKSKSQWREAVLCEKFRESKYKKRDITNPTKLSSKSFDFSIE